MSPRAAYNDPRDSSAGESQSEDEHDSSVPQINQVRRAQNAQFEAL